MSELIDREAVREFIKSYRHTTDVAFDMEKHLDEIPAASPWHRVEEPPDMDEYVLAFDGDIVVMASFDGEKWWQHDTYESFPISPSYWMPLPEPPKE